MADKKEQKPEPVKKKVGNAYVTKPFRDIANFDTKYEVDQDVTELGEKRIAELVSKGVVAIEAEPEKPAA